MAKRSDGFTLIEVLVTLIILSIGLLGLAALQTSGLKFTQDAYLRSQATALAYSVIEQLRLDSDTTNSGVPPVYSDTFTAADSTAKCNFISSSPSAAINCWRITLRDNLPAGALSISTPDTSNTLTVTLTWQNNWQQREAREMATSSQSWTVTL